MLHPGAPRLSPAPVDGSSCVVVGMSWDSLWPVSWAPSPQDLCKAGARSCGKGWGGADRAEQWGCSPLAPAVPQAHQLSWQLGLLTSSCAWLHLNPPSCLISKANSLSDKSMSRGCPDWLCHRPVSQRGRGFRQDLDLRTPVDVMLRRGVQPRPQRKTVSPPADLYFWGALGKLDYLQGHSVTCPRPHSRKLATVEQSPLTSRLACSAVAEALVILSNPPCFALSSTQQAPATQLYPTVSSQRQAGCTLKQRSVAVPSGPGGGPQHVGGTESKGVKGKGMPRVDDRRSTTIEEKYRTSSSDREQAMETSSAFRVPSSLPGAR
uniref:uncharacterized protein LOC118534611 n=1 Tax=Halichoerus grypus TaxID=9711 RepID=UPI0016595A99|nr:uncharacterized protein LOC118534611 [Halichoerus grypus]